MSACYSTRRSLFGAQQLSAQYLKSPLQEIRAAILHFLIRGHPHLKLVAKKVGMTQRTLQRRLSAEGTTYSQLVNELRFGVAAKLLEDPNVPIASIASKVGFARHASLSRAFHSWAAMTPSQYRSQLLPGSARGKRSQS